MINLLSLLGIQGLIPLHDPAVAEHHQCLYGRDVGYAVERIVLDVFTIRVGYVASFPFRKLPKKTKRNWFVSHFKVP